MQMLSNLTTSQVLFKDLICLIGTIILRNNSLVLTGQDHIHSMHDFQSKLISSQFNYTFVILEGEVCRKVAVQKLLTKTGKG